MKPAKQCPIGWSPSGITGVRSKNKTRLIVSRPSPKPHYTRPLVIRSDQCLPVKSDSALIAELKGYQSELQSSENGSLNGFSKSALRGLAEAQQRGLDLEPICDLQQWSTKQIVVWSEVRRFLELIGRNDDPRLVVALFPPDPGKPMIHMPQEGAIDHGEIERVLNSRAADQLSLGMVVNRAAAVPHDWGSKPDHFGGKRPSRQRTEVPDLERPREGSENAK